MGAGCSGGGKNGGAKPSENPTAGADSGSASGGGGARKEGEGGGKHNPNVDCPTTNLKLDIEDGPSITYAYLSMRGYYPNDPNKPNQDNFVVKETFGAKNRALFGVYDGHGHVGHETAIFARDNLPPSMKLTLEDFDRTQGKERSYDQALTDAHVATNEKLHKSPIDDAMSGTTSVTVLIDKSDLTIMNLGDSRAIIASELESMRASRASAGDIDASKSPEGGARSGNTRLVAKALSYDQTPYRKDERERCKVAGARIMTMDQIDGVEPLHENFNTSLGDELDEQGDPPRVWSKLGDYPGCAFTRSFGDMEGERVGVFAEPEITKHSLRVNDRLIVIASDGVFEFLTNQQVVNLIKEYPDDPLMACRKVVSEAYQAWLQYEMRTDDITIIIIQINSVPAGAARASGEIAPPEEAKNADGESMELKPVKRAMAKGKQLIGEGDEDDEDDGAAIDTSPDTKSPEEREAIINAVRNMFLFKSLGSSQLALLARTAQRVNIKAGETLIKQGDIGDNLYIVADGALSVHVRAPDASAEVRDVGRSVHTYEGSTEAGQHPYFGELALQYKGTTRAATVIATRDTSLWAISRKIFKCVAIRMTTRKELVGSLKRVEILNKLGATQLQHLADVVSDARFSEGEKVITEGDVGNEMFVVHEGTAAATKLIDGEMKQLKTYGPGDYFGERALVKNEPRAANIVATSPTLKCYRIERHVFELELAELEMGFADKAEAEEKE